MKKNILVFLMLGGVLITTWFGCLKKDDKLYYTDLYWFRKDTLKWPIIIKPDTTILKSVSVFRFTDQTGNQDYVLYRLIPDSTTLTLGREFRLKNPDTVHFLTPELTRGLISIEFFPDSIGNGGKIGLQLIYDEQLAPSKFRKHSKVVIQVYPVIKSDQQSSSR